MAITFGEFLRLPGLKTSSNFILYGLGNIVRCFSYSLQNSCSLKKELIQELTHLCFPRFYQPLVHRSLYRFVENYPSLSFPFSSKVAMTWVRYIFLGPHPNVLCRVMGVWEESPPGHSERLHSSPPGNSTSLISKQFSELTSFIKVF